MKKILTFALLFSLTTTYGQSNKSFNKNVTKWFKAWEHVSTEIYGLKNIKPTEFLFFDDNYVYTTSEISGKDGEIINGPKMFGEKFIWRKKQYKDTIILPDGQKRKAELMCFTIPFYGKEKLNAFFVMPILSYWTIHNPGDHGIGYEKLTSSVFVHEFCHSQQLEKGMNGMEQGAFDKYFSAHENEVFMDDIMQEIYKNDTIYKHEYEKELDLFIRAYQAKTKEEMKLLAKQALDAMIARQMRILKENKRDLAEIDNYWLTLEGVAQYTSFLWLINPKGGKLSISDALKAEKTDSWSQEEGLAIVYLFSKFSEPKQWADKMFRSKTINIIDLLKKEIGYTN